jgi:hypothetical protein
LKIEVFLLGAMGWNFLRIKMACWGGNWVIAGLFGVLLGFCWVIWVIAGFLLGFLGSPGFFGLSPHKDRDI